MVQTRSAAGSDVAAVVSTPVGQKQGTAIAEMVKTPTQAMGQAPTTNILDFISSDIARLSEEGQRSVETVDLAGSRYFISQTSPYVPSLNWFLAYQYCRTIGMELLSIGTAEEAELINSYLAANRLSNQDYWTSGNQLGSHHWMWMATGQRFNTSFNYWAHEESFTKLTAACMSVNNGAWVPEDCMHEKYFICELTRCFFVNFVSANRGSSQG